MSERQRELAARREALRAESALQREFLGRAVNDVESRLVGLDRGIDIARRVASKPVVLAGGIALIALIGPKRLLNIAGKSAMLFAARVEMPGASRAPRSAWPNEMRSRVDSASTHASARSPMPRRGVLRTRRMLTVSSSLTIARRYASASRTSLRS